MKRQTEVSPRRLKPAARRIDVRPTGVLQPADERAVRALQAIDDRRPADALQPMAAIPDSPFISRAWKYYLQGRVAAAQLNFETAESLFFQAFSLAFVASTPPFPPLLRGGDGDFPPLVRGGVGGEEDLPPFIRGGKGGCIEGEALRLASLALVQAGWVYRRQDRLEEAYQTHLAAYRLGEHHASYDELWQITTELGLDGDVVRRFEESERWHRRAIEAGEKACIQPAFKQATAWTNLSTCLTKSERYDEGILAARTARDWWRKHDVGAVTAAQADLKLGAALLGHAEALFDRGAPAARSVLEEAVEWLTAAREALMAFGPEAYIDVQSCGERIDFAERLRASLAGFDLSLPPLGNGGRGGDTR